MILSTAVVLPLCFSQHHFMCHQKYGFLLHLHAFPLFHRVREKKKNRARIQIASLQNSAWMLIVLLQFIKSPNVPQVASPPLTTVPSGVLVLFLPALPAFWQQRKLTSAMDINRVVRYSYWRRRTLVFLYWTRLKHSQLVHFLNTYSVHTDNEGQEMESSLPLSPLNPSHLTTSVLLWQQTASLELKITRSSFKLMLCLPSKPAT